MSPLFTVIAVMVLDLTLEAMTSCLWIYEKSFILAMCLSNATSRWSHLEKIFCLGLCCKIMIFLNFFWLQRCLEFDLNSISFAPRKRFLKFDHSSFYLRARGCHSAASSATLSFNFALTTVLSSHFNRRRWSRLRFLGCGCIAVLHLDFVIYWKEICLQCLEWVSYYFSRIILMQKMPLLEFIVIMEAKSWFKFINYWMYPEVYLRWLTRDLGLDW